MDNQRRNRGPWNATTETAPRKPEPRRDAGAYIGRMPERTPEMPPGGFGRRDQRSGPAGGQPAPVRSADAPAPGTNPDASTTADAAPTAQAPNAATRPDAATGAEGQRQATNVGDSTEREAPKTP